MLPDSYLDVPNKDYGGENHIKPLFYKESAPSLGLNFLIISIFLCLIFFGLGDLFIDGKVIHRPQYRYNERQPTRIRPRPRYDRRRETMQVERREPMQRENWAQGQRETMQQPTSMNEQNPPHGGGRASP